MRRLLFIAPLLIAISTFSVTARGQASVYGTGMSGAFGFTGDNYPAGPAMKPAAPGFIAGAFYTLAGASRFKGGIDARVTHAAGYNGGSAYTAAVRFSFVPNRLLFRPYAEFGGGVASTQLHGSVCGLTCSPTTTQITGGVVQVDAGLDLRVTQRLDLRAFDYEQDRGGSRGTTSAAVRSFSGGVVLHFGGPRIGGR